MSDVSLRAGRAIKGSDGNHTPMRSANQNRMGATTMTAWIPLVQSIRLPVVRDLSASKAYKDVSNNPSLALVEKSAFDCSPSFH